MPGRQRLLAAIAGRPIDRIPVAPFIHLNYVREFFGEHDLDFVTKTIEVYEEFGFDLIHRNCTPAYDDLNLQGEGWECRIEKISLSGRDEDLRYTIRTPSGALTQTFGIRWSCPWDCEVAPLEYLIKTELDFEILRRWQPPVGRVDTMPIRRAKEAVGERGITAPWLQGAFNHVGYLYRRLDDLALDPLVRPRFYREMMDYFLERNLAIARQYIEAGTDMISLGLNIASGKMFNFEFVRDQVAPFETRLIRSIQAGGTGVIGHNCGYARQLLPVYPQMGMTVYESLTPPPHGDTPLEEAVAVLGPHMALMGGIDQIDLLRTGTPSQIEEAVRRVLKVVRGNCRYILATSDYFHENTPRENIRALAQSSLNHE